MQTANDQTRYCRKAESADCTEKPCRNLVDLMLKYSNTVIIGQHKLFVRGTLSQNQTAECACVQNNLCHLRMACSRHKKKLTVAAVVLQTFVLQAFLF